MNGLQFVGILIFADYFSKHGCVHHTAPLCILFENCLYSGRFCKPSIFPVMCWTGQLRNAILQKRPKNRPGWLRKSNETKWNGHNDVIPFKDAGFNKFWQVTHCCWGLPVEYYCHNWIIYWWLWCLLRVFFHWGFCLCTDFPHRYQLQVSGCRSTIFHIRSTRMPEFWSRI